MEETSVNIYIIFRKYQCNTLKMMKILQVKIVNYYIMMLRNILTYMHIIYVYSTLIGYQGNTYELCAYAVSCSLETFVVV